METPRVPLFDGSDVAEDEAVVALLSLASRHRLTYACIEDILHFVSSLLPMPNGLTISLHRLIGKSVNFSKETTVHKFCGAVLHNGAKCTKSACVSVSQPDATFIEIPLQNQIQEKMQGKDAWYKINAKLLFRYCVYKQMRTSTSWYSIVLPGNVQKERYKMCMTEGSIKIIAIFFHVKVIYP